MKKAATCNGPFSSAGSLLLSGEKYDKMDEINQYNLTESGDILDITTTSLFDLNHTLAGDYLRRTVYPWEALDGISSLILDGKIDRTQVRKKYDISVASKRGKTPGKKSVDGNALSYPESEVLFEYLAEKYGMDAAVEAYMNGLAPDQAFGISYSELLAEAKAYFTEQYWRD